LRIRLLNFGGFGIPNFELIAERPRGLRILIVLYVLTEELGGEVLCESIWPSIPDFIELLFRREIPLRVRSRGLGRAL
jgi:hypothetical protein